MKASFTSVFMASNREIRLEHGWVEIHSFEYGEIMLTKICKRSVTSSAISCDKLSNNLDININASNCSDITGNIEAQNWYSSWVKFN